MDSVPDFRRRLREHAYLSLVFVASRALLWIAGLEFNFALSWMWLADPAELREELFYTLYYFHAFPPGMNFLTGVLLKLGGDGAATLAALVFSGFGLLLVNALLYLCRVSGLPPRGCVALAAAFCLTPPAIYYENLYIYEAPVAALLAWSAVCFHRAIERPSVARFAAFFALLAAVGAIRSTFHLVWFVAMTAVAAWFSRRALKRVLVGAAAPFALLLALYLKNWAVFGIFDAFSFGPVSLNLVTVRHLPRATRDAWIAEGKLSPFSAISEFAGPREYLPYFPSSENPAFPPALSRLDKPTLGTANYNHWLYLPVMQRRRADAVYYVRTLPGAYAGTALRGLRDFFSASTAWHPLDHTERSPHHEHRRVLGGYERLYNRLFHGFPFAPVGVYVLLPLVLFWATRAVFKPKRGARGLALAALYAFCTIQIVYVVLASNLFTFQESARYRYQIEPFIWLLTALAATDYLRSRRAASRRSSQRVSSTTTSTT